MAGSFLLQYMKDCCVEAVYMPGLIYLLQASIKRRCIFLIQAAAARLSLHEDGYFSSDFLSALPISMISLEYFFVVYSSLSLHLIFSLHMVFHFFVMQLHPLSLFYLRRQFFYKLLTPGGFQQLFIKQ